MKKLNKKGFTLIELLAVIVILIAIVSIAIPSITATLERNKAKITEHKKEIIVSAGELYVSDHKNAITSNCYISLITLVNNGYLEESDLKSANSTNIDGYLNVNISTRTVMYDTTSSGDECP